MKNENLFYLVIIVLIVVIAVVSFWAIWQSDLPTWLKFFLLR